LVEGAAAASLLVEVAGQAGRVGEQVTHCDGGTMVDAGDDMQTGYEVDIQVTDDGVVQCKQALLPELHDHCGRVQLGNRSDEVRLVATVAVRPAGAGPAQAEGDLASVGARREPVQYRVELRVGC